MRKIFLSVIFTLSGLLISAQGVGALEPLSVTEFTPPGSIHDFRGITGGPDGNMWYTAMVNGNPSIIGKVTTAGEISEFPIPVDPGASFVPYDISKGPDGNLWFTGYVNEPSIYKGAKIGKIRPHGEVEQIYAIDTVDSRSFRITAGADGNLWFTQSLPKIGRITPAGSITEFQLSDSNYSTYEITLGIDGNIWFTAQNTTNNSCAVGKITSTGNVSVFPVPESGTGCTGITSGQDGQVWFIHADSRKIGRITQSGEITLFSVPSGNIPKRMTKGPDGNIWFTEGNSEFIGKIDNDGNISELPISLAGGQPDFITAGPDGNIWFTEVISNTKIGRINLVSVTPTPTPTPKPESVFELSGTAIDQNNVLLDRVDLVITCGNNTRKTRTNRQGKFRVSLSTKSNCLIGNISSITATRNGVTGIGEATVQKGGKLGMVTIPLLSEMEKKVLVAIEWAKMQANKDQTLRINNYYKRCLPFVRDAWEYAGISTEKLRVNPVSYWNNFPKYFERHEWAKEDSTVPPVGALVIWGVNRWEREDGHIALSLGNGYVISTWAVPYANGVKKDESIFTFHIYNGGRNPTTYNLKGWIIPR